MCLHNLFYTTFYCVLNRFFVVFIVYLLIYINIVNNKLVYGTDKVDYYLKHKILDAFLELLYEHNSGIYSLADKPMNLDLFIISLIPDDVVEEYERIRENYESELKQLIKKVEELPTNLL